MVLTNSLKSHFYGSFAAALTRRPVAWFFHEVVDQPYYSKSIIWCLVVWANLFARCIFCNSIATRDALTRAGVRVRDLPVIYTPPISVGVRSASSIRSEMGLPVESVLVTMVGRISPLKGQLEFVQAASEIVGRRPNVFFVIVGGSLFGELEDSYRSKIERAVSASSDPRRFMVLGMRSDVLDIVDASDVVVFPSLVPEGFGRAVAEAMELAKPVVATALGGTAELVMDEVTGLKVVAGDVGSLRTAIERLLDKPELAKEFGEAGQRHIRRLLSWDNVKRFEESLERTGAR